jgi:hypothetical protein
MTAEHIAKFFGCTIEQAKAQFAANALQLAAMQKKAIFTGKKVNGYTANQLKNHAESMAKKAKWQAVNDMAQAALTPPTQLTS